MKTKKNLSLYIHIPFCKAKCFYCDFLSGNYFLKYKKEYIDSLINEINLLNDKIILKKNNEVIEIPFNINDYVISTIYFGGGTPSILEIDDINKIVNAIYNKFEIKEKVEISIEVNPESVTVEKIKAWKNLNINRISMGMQSSDNSELKAIGRIHTYEMFIKSYYSVVNDIHNINIDIMYNIPTQSTKSFQNTIEKVIGLNPKHISIYSFILEKNTKFYIDKKNHMLNYDKEKELDYDEIIKSYINKSNYYRYEVSNYAKKGFMCRHNITYFENNDYLSFGIGASSHLGYCRFYNEKNIEKYINYPNSKYLERKTDINLDIEDTIIMSLRKTNGINKDLFKKKYNKSIDELYKDKIDKYTEMKLMVNDGSRLYLSERGIEVSNIILADFIR